MTSGGEEEQLPSGPPLEERLMDYIKTHNGELAINSASTELSVPTDTIRRSLQKLKEDGKIVLD